MLRKIIKKISKVTVVAGVTMAILTSMASATSIKDYPRVAVMNFGNKAITSKGLRDHDFSLCTEYAIYQLQASNWFDLIDYESLNTIVQMHNISNTGLVDPSTIVAMGQFAGAEYIIVGNVTGLTAKETDTGLRIKNANAGVKEHIVTANVSMRIVDIKTGRNVVAGIGRGSSTSTLTEIGFIRDRWVERAKDRSTTSTIAGVLIDEYAGNRNSNNGSKRNSNSDSSHMDYNNTNIADGSYNDSYHAGRDSDTSSEYDNSVSSDRTIIDSKGNANYNSHDSEHANANGEYNDRLINNETLNTSNDSSNSSRYSNNSSNDDYYKKYSKETMYTDDTNYTYVKEQEVYGITIGTAQVSEIQVINAISKAIRDAIYGKMGLLTTLNDGKPLNIKTGF